MRLPPEILRDYHNSAAHTPIRPRTDTHRNKSIVGVPYSMYEDLTGSTKSILVNEYDQFFTFVRVMDLQVDFINSAVKGFKVFDYYKLHYILT
jgi:hypothetical protein